MEAFEDYVVSRNEDLLKKQPKPVAFTYTQYQLQAIIDDYINEYNKKIVGIPSNEEYGSWGGVTTYRDIDVVRTVEKFNKLPDKSDYKEVSSISQTIDMMKPEGRNLPDPIMTTINELRKHSEYLNYIKLLHDQEKEQQIKLDQEQKIRSEQDSVQQKQDQAQKEQQERNEYIQRQLEVIHNKFEVIKANKEVYEPIKIELLKDRAYFFHVKNNATQSDINKIDDYVRRLSSLEQEVISKRQIEDVQKNTDEQEQIERLREQLATLNSQIASMVEYMKPYMQVSKVNREMTKVIEKNRELDTLQIVDSVSDYQRIIETKKELVEFLVKATDFIKTRVEQSRITEQPVVEKPVVQQPVQQPVVQTGPEPLPDNFWDEFDKPIEREEHGPLPPDFWKEFDSPEQLTKPERMFNLDGTYTYEYMAYLATTPLGFSKDIYDQLEQYNATVRQQKTEGIEVVFPETQSSGGMHM